MASTPAPPSSPPRAVPALVLALVLVGLALRAWLATRGGVWRDEGLYLHIVALPGLGEMLGFLRTSESHPPLYYLLGRAWGAPFGGGEGPALALAVACGTAAIPLAHAVASRVAGWPAGLAAAAMVAIAPGAAEMAGQARPYALLQVLCLASVWALHRALVAGGARAWGAWAAAIAAMIYVHHWAWVVWAASIAAALGWVAMPGSRPAKRVVAELLAACVAAGVAYLPWLPAMLGQLGGAGHPAEGLVARLGAGAAVFHYAREFGAFALGLMPEAGAQAAMLVAAAVLGAAAARLAGALGPPAPRADGPPPALWLLAGVPLGTFVLALALSPWANLLIRHCYLIVAPCLLAAVAVAVAVLAGPRRPAALAAAAAGFALATAPAWSALAPTAKSNAREAAALVAAQARPADLVLVTPVWLASSFNLYYAPATEQLDFPDGGRRGAVAFMGLAPRMADPAAYARALAAVEAARRAGRRVWLVTDPAAVSLGNVPLAPALPAAVPPRDYGLVGKYRSAQLAVRLFQLYGAPALEATPGARRAYVHEVVYVARFDPPAR